MARTCNHPRVGATKASRQRRSRPPSLRFGGLGRALPDSSESGMLAPDRWSSSDGRPRVRVAGVSHATVAPASAGPTRDERQRQEGNGRGDTVRLSTRGILRGVGTSRGGSRDPSSGESRAEGHEGAKRGEPQDRQRDATSPQLCRGANRRGGEKPRGRNMALGWLRVPEGRLRPNGSGRGSLRRWRGGPGRIPREEGVSPRLRPRSDTRFEP